jgi:4-hydroxyproline epimerase
MAVLHHRGELAVGETWRQESIIGSRFTGWLDQEGSDLIPSIRGQAWITSRATLLFDRSGAQPMWWSSVPVWSVPPLPTCSLAADSA